MQLLQSRMFRQIYGAKICPNCKQREMRFSKECGQWFCYNEECHYGCRDPEEEVKQRQKKGEVFPFVV